MPKRVLVVDDDQDIHALVKMVLVPPDYEVDGIENGEIALKKLEKEALPDILLLDLVMPRMTGYALLDHLYDRGLHTSLAIIVMSADLMTWQQMVRLGIRGFLTKPFDIADLQQVIEKI